MSAPPSEESGKGGSGGAIFGARPETLLHSPFFTAFRFVEYESAQAIGAGRTWRGYRPCAPHLADGATLNLEIDAEGGVDQLTLCLDRGSVDGAVDSRFARDLAASFLVWSLPEADRAAIGDLIEEIGDRTRSGAAAPPVSDTRAAATLPRFPSAGYRVFLGHQGNFDQDLPDSQLRIVNLNWSRRHDQAATPPGYDGETVWLWLIVRRRR
ncbi:MAG TPA: hypothetical protein VM639_16665 [Dongiaceae bacterium]|nr:hypothetical protein [Dongiaceae bacterium]